MHLSLSRKIPLLVLFALNLTFASSSPVQGAGNTKVKPKETGGMIVTIESNGALRVALTIPVKLDDTASLRQALIRSFNLPLTLDPPRKSPYLDDEDEVKFTLIEAHNSQAFTEPGLFSSLRIQPGSLAGELRSHGIKTLTVTLMTLKSLSNVKVVGIAKRGLPPYMFYQGNINTENPDAAGIDLSWGYQRSDLAGQSLPVVLFILVPLILTIWMGSSVLKLKDRPAEMWGKYFRFLYRLINSIWFFWFPVYAWANISEIVPVILGPGYRSYWRGVEIALWVGPPMLVMWLCHVFSHRVYRNVRGAEWSPAAVMRQAMLGGSLAFIPLFGVMLGVSIGGGNLRKAALVMMVVVVIMFVLVALFGKAMRRSLYSITHGELRDRVFELAGRAGVKLNQIYVLPDGQAQMSNAFARSDNAVMLTASLLRHLSKREVDAIMGHEIGHLKERHPQQKSMITTTVLVVAYIVASSLASMIDLQRWAPAMLSLAFAGSMFLLHFVSRSNERHADAIGVGLTGDPEAFISGLAKIEKLNLMPMHGGGAFEFGTHPQTLRRLQDIARMHQVSPERLQVLLSGDEQIGAQYHFGQVSESQAKIFSTEFKRAYIMVVSFTMLGILVFAPVVFALVLSRTRLQGAIQFGAYLAAIGAAWLIFQIARNFLLSYDFGSVEQRIRSKISREGMTQAADEGVFVGFAPSGQLRRYEMLTFWDVGLLWLADDRLFYLGEGARFELNRRQIVDVRLAMLDPAPVHRRRLIVEWCDERSSNRGAFYVTIPRTILQNRRRMFELEERIGVWLRQTGSPVADPGSMPRLLIPAFGAITSAPASTKFDPALTIKAALKLAIPSCFVSFLFQLPFWSACYAIGVTMLLVLLDELPKLYYGVLMEEREAQPQQPAYQRGAWMESDAVTKSSQ